ncbi:helix-turn-helix transcriptional regulator [Pseudoclavibacter sp. VKM Ac-2888]|uniref:helix-turn-helix transcriptional regulator n=1 Tax=Pseudoclavibacter sp. VKM Ac-2888 TaxID=2783830 RepID=UPI00188D06F7|nr:helix-turn-helix domain-containing protein [Pseudoclavibacter sp. VKM Ac-2888]MBF4549251.1 helix-turn-helix domain-containing protein [Pseudoclavibacter sp. VKM Ac-2888]
MPGLPDDPLLTTEQAAEMLAIRPDLLREWKYLDLRDGGDRGPQAIKLGRLVRYRLSELEAWIGRHNP